MADSVAQARRDPMERADGEKWSPGNGSEKWRVNVSGARGRHGGGVATATATRTQDGLAGGGLAAGVVGEVPFLPYILRKVLSRRFIWSGCWAKTTTVAEVSYEPISFVVSPHQARPKEGNAAVRSTHHRPDLEQETLTGHAHNGKPQHGLGSRPKVTPSRPSLPFSPSFLPSHAECTADLA